MNTATLPAGIRPSRYSPRTYAAFKAEQIGPRWSTRAFPLIGEPVTLDEAVAAAVLRCHHKQTLVIRETDDGASTLYVFRIRKAAPKWITPPGEYLPRRVEDLYADLITVLDGSVLS